MKWQFDVTASSFDELADTLAVIADEIEAGSVGRTEPDEGTETLSLSLSVRGLTTADVLRALDAVGLRVRRGERRGFGMSPGCVYAFTVEAIS